MRKLSCCSLAFSVAIACRTCAANAQTHARNQPPAAAPLPPTRPPAVNIAPAPSAAPVAAPTVAPVKSNTLLSTVTLADIGFSNGVRFGNLGGRREIFVPLPQGGTVASTELVLVLDDMSAHEARRSLEILVNDRSAAAIALDGKGMGRIVRVPLAGAAARDGFLKLTFLYSGAATQDRCIDVRYVGDSLTVRPESAIEIDVGLTGILDVATTAAIMPRDVAVVLPGRRLIGGGFRHRTHGRARAHRLRPPRRLPSRSGDAAGARQARRRQPMGAWPCRHRLAR